jgi:hypothetical protein
MGYKYFDEIYKRAYRVLIEGLKLFRRYSEVVEGLTDRRRS